MIVNSIIKSLEHTYHFLREVVLSESHNPANVETQDRSSRAVQGKTTRGRNHESDFEGKCCGSGRSGGHGEVIYCYYCNEPDHTKYNCSLLQGK